MINDGGNGIACNDDEDVLCSHTQCTKNFSHKPSTPKKLSTQFYKRIFTQNLLRIKNCFTHIFAFAGHVLHREAKIFRHFTKFWHIERFYTWRSWRWLYTFFYAPVHLHTKRFYTDVFAQVHLPASAFAHRCFYTKKCKTETFAGALTHRCVYTCKCLYKQNCFKWSPPWNFKAYILTISDIYPDILLSILSDIHSGILSAILSGIYSGILSAILSGICSGILSDILFWHSFLAFYLASILISYLASFLASNLFWHFLWHSFW